jgi:hypothetical protein
MRVQMVALTVLLSSAAGVTARQRLTVSVSPIDHSLRRHSRSA